MWRAAMRHDSRGHGHEQAGWAAPRAASGKPCLGAGRCCEQRVCRGKALGAGTIDSAFQGIGNGTGAATVPGFGQRTPQSQVFQAGQGQLSGPGTAKIIDCASQAPDVDSYRRQECDAVNFVARNPAVRPAFSIDRANDPLISRARAIARNPTMGATGIAAGNPAEQCRVVTETQPASFSRETCNDYRPVSSSFCSTARQISVDQHHRYQCVEQMLSSEVLFTPTNFQPSFSFYGLTLSTGTMSTGLLGGPIYSLGTVGPFNFYFDPYSLAIAVAMQLISELLSCQEAEKLLAMHREANLCVPVGSFCSRRVPIIRTCIEQTQSYCCFNSRLARIINEQGRGQVGKGWGSGKRPDCSGFTPEEFEQIDFSRIDLSEFIAEVVASVRVPSASAIGQNVQSTVQQRVESYYRR
jgi:hypothetical protein